MRWFKHMTATKDDEKIVELLAIGGLEAYGFYWAVVELIARQMEKESDKCSVTYPLPYLSRQLYCHHNKVTNLLSKLQVTGLMEVNKIEVDGRVNFKITCQNLLKYRDEYTTKKTKNRDKIKTISRQTQEQETDTDTDTEAEAEKNAIPQKITNLLKPLNKISPSPLEIKNLVLAAKAGCTQDTVKNLLRRKPAITGFSHSWQVDELMAQLRIDKGDGDDIDAELERRYGKRSN